MIPERNPYNNWNGNGSTTTFDFDFYIENATQLAVYHTNTDGVQTTLRYGIDYSINELQNENGSYITFPIVGSSYSTLADGEIISLCLTLPISQENEYGQSSYLNLETLEYSLDYLTRIAQILNRQLQRAVKLKEGSNIDTDTLVSNINNIADDLPAIEAVNENKTNINAVKNNLTNINKVANNVSDIISCADNIPDIQTVAEFIEEHDFVDKTSTQTISGTKTFNHVYSTYSGDGAAFVHTRGAGNPSSTGGFRTRRTDTNQSVSLSIGTNGYDRGIYDDANNYWLINADSNGIIKSKGKTLANLEDDQTYTGSNTFDKQMLSNVSSSLLLTLDSGSCFVARAKRTDTENDIALGIGSGGTSRGIYDNKNSKWIIAADENNKLTSFDKEVLTLKQYYKSGNSWYRITSDGWCQQGGYKLDDTSTDEYTLTFTKPFNDESYEFSLIQQATNTPVNNIKIISKRPTYIKIYAEYAFWWFAEGYLAS
jgi:hypothetical protein